MDKVDASEILIGEQLFGRFDESGRQVSAALFDLLRDAGLRIGPRERIAAAALVGHIIAERAANMEVRDLRADLAPLLARSPAEREQYFRIFDAFAPAPPPPSSSPDLAAAPQVSGTFSAVPRAHKLLKPRSRQVVAMALIAFAMLAAGIAWFVMLQTTPHIAMKPAPKIQATGVNARAAAVPPKAVKPDAPQSAATRLVNRVVEGSRNYDGAPTLEELSIPLARNSPIHWRPEAYAQRLQELTGLPKSEPLALSGLAEQPKGRDPALVAAVARALAHIESPGREDSPDEFQVAAEQTTFGISMGAALDAGFEIYKQVCEHCHDPTAVDFHALEGEAANNEAGRRIAYERRLSGIFAGVQSSLPSDPFIAETLAETLVKAVASKTTAAARAKKQNGIPYEKGAAIAYVRKVAGNNYRDDTILRALAILPNPGMRRVFADAPWLKRDGLRVERAPVWAPFAVPLLSLLLVSLSMFGAFMLRKAYLRRRAPMFPPLHMVLLADAAKHLHNTAGLFQRIGQRLQRRTPVPSGRLDVEATVRATIAQGVELVVPRFAHTRAAPDYLVLIEKRSEGDQNFDYLRFLVSKLTDLVAFDIYTFQNEPSMLEPDGGGQAVPIERLAAAYPHHRLLVLGSGAEFLDPVHHKPLAGAAMLTRWTRRALLTPIPLAEWAQEEFLLAQELALPIGRATPEGLMALAELLRLEGTEDDDLLDPSGDGLAPPLPEVLRARPQRYLYNAPPEDHPLPQIVQDLRNYLDGPGFDWLCALAVYPAVQWDLTLYLGLMLPEQPGGDAPRAPLYSEERIAALTQLPWLREGRIPTWMRRALIAAMCPARGNEVRTLVRELIVKARSTGDPARDEAIRIRIGRETTKEVANPEQLLEDEVLLDFLARGRMEDFELPRMRFLERFLPESWLHRLGWAELASLIVALGYAVAGYSLSPKPADGALVTSAWLPLFSLALVAAGLAIITNLGRVYVYTRRIVMWSAPYGLALSIAAAALVPGAAVSNAVADNYKALPMWIALVPAAVLPVIIARRLASAAGLDLHAAAGSLARRVLIGGMRIAAADAVALAAFFWAAAAQGLPSAFLLDALSNEIILIGGIAGVLGAMLFAAGLAFARFSPDRLPPVHDKFFAALTQAVTFDAEMDTAHSGWRKFVIWLGPYALAFAMASTSFLWTVRNDLDFSPIWMLGGSAFLPVPFALTLARWLKLRVRLPREGILIRMFAGLASVLVIDSAVIGSLVLADQIEEWMGHGTPRVIENYVCLGLSALSTLLFLYAVVAARRPFRQPRNLRTNIALWAERRALFLSAFLALLPILPVLVLTLILAGEHSWLPAPPSSFASSDVVATTQDGLYFATGDGDGLVRVFLADDVSSPLSTIHADGGRIVSLAISPLADSSSPERPSKFFHAALLVVAVTAHGKGLQAWDTDIGSDMKRAIPGSEQIAAINTGGAIHLAVGKNEGWAASGEDRKGKSWILTNAGAIALADGGPVTALVPVRPEWFGYGRLDGSLGLVTVTKTNVHELYPAAAPNAAKLFPPVQPKFELRGHSAAVSAVSYSPDGSRISTSSDDGSVRIWDAATGAPLRTVIAGHEKSVSDVEFSPDGSYVVMAAGHDKDPARRCVLDGQPACLRYDGTDAAIVVNSSTGVKLTELQHDGVNTATFSPDGSRVMTADNNEVCIWDLKKSRRAKCVTDQLFTSAKFSPDGKRFVTAGSGAAVWDTLTGKKVFTLNAGPNSMLSAAYTTDGRKIITSSLDHTLKGWSALDGKLLDTIAQSVDFPDAVKISPDGQSFAATNSDVRIFDIGGKKPPTQLPRAGRALAVAFSPGGTEIVVGYADGTVRVWQIAAHAGVAIRSLQVDPAGKLTAIDTEGAVIEGRIENNRLAGLAFTDIDSRLALGPAVTWQSSPTSPKLATPPPEQISPAANGDTMSGTPTFIDSATLAISGTTIHLYGVLGAGGEATRLARLFLSEQGGRLNCNKKTGSDYVCTTPTGIDVAAAELLNGAAKVNDRTLSYYLGLQEKAKADRRGFWADR
jgi:WD40 repeat protein